MEKLKQNYTVRVEGTVPVEIDYLILAEDEQEALKILERGITNAPTKFKYFKGRLRKKRARVFKHGTINVMATKNY